MYEEESDQDEKPKLKRKIIAEACKAPKSFDKFMNWGLV